MGGLKISEHNGVICAGATVKFFRLHLDVYVYVSDGLLVDAGPSRLARKYADFFWSQPIRQAVITHFHEDHSGNGPLLAGLGIPVYVHRSAVPFYREKARLKLYRRIFWGMRGGFYAFPLDSAFHTERKRWRVLELPGHSFDHIALYDPQDGSVFTGDLFVTARTRLVMSSENVPQIIDSLRTLLQCDFQTLYCGHAGVVENGREMIRKKLAYLENLRGEVLALYQKGWSIQAINKKIFPKKAALTYISGGEWSSEHIVRSIVNQDPDFKQRA